MGITAHHVFTSPIADGTNTQLVRPSNWNSAHIISYDGLAGTGFSGTNISGTVDSAGISLSAPAMFRGGVSTGGNTVGTTGTVSNQILFVGGNNVTLSQSSAAGGATISMSVGNYITTARASNDAVGLATALTAGPLAWTVNSAGISLNASSAAGTTSGFAGNLISGSMTHNTAGLNLSLNHPAWLTTAAQSSVSNVSGVVAGTASNAATNQTAQLSGNISFWNGSGVSFFTSASGATSGIAATVKTDYLTSQSNQAWSGSNASSTFQTLSFNNANGASWSNNAGAVEISYTRPVVSNAIASVGSATNSGTNTSRFAADDHVHAGVFSMGVSTGGNTVGDTRVDVGRFVFQGGNAVTLSQITAANALNTIVISGAGGGVTNQTGPNIADTAATITSGTVVFSNSNNVSFGLNGSTMTGSIPLFMGTNLAATNINFTTGTNGWSLNNVDNHYVAWNLVGNNTSGTTATTLTTAGALFLSGGNNVTLSGNSNTIVVSGGMNTQRFQWPPGNLTVVAALGNGSFSINRMQCDVPISATRMDVPFLLSLASSATANTWGLAVTAFGAIYTKNGATLSSLSSAQVQWSTSLASNTAGGTQIIPHAIRPLSIPLNVNMSVGEYYIGFGVSTNTSSAGTATTALGNTWSVMGGLIYSSAVPHNADFTATTNATTGLFGGQGIYTAAISTVPPTVSLSAISQSGSYYARANFGAIFRNI